jgi:uncharacterized membrane protein YfcA
VTTAQLVAVGVAVFFAAAVQVVSGFGFALLSVPLMTLAIPTKDAVVVSTIVGLVITVWQAVHLRADTDRPLAKRCLIGAYVGMPLGLVLFLTLDDHVLRLMLGVAVLVAVVLLLLRYPSADVPVSFDYGAGFVSGILNTSLSTNGPPLAFSLSARRLQPEVFRATINTIFALSAVVSLTMFVVAGKVTREGLFAAAVAMPSMFLGQVAGLPLRKYVHGDRFRWLTIGLMVLAGTSAIYFALR